MANRNTELRTFWAAALGTTLAIIATAFVAQGIFKAGATAGAREMLKMCQSGHPACWPKKPVSKTS